MPDQLNHGLLTSAGKQRALAKVAPLREGQIILHLEESTALSSWAARQETGKKSDLNYQKSKSQVCPHALGCPHPPADPSSTGLSIRSGLKNLNRMKSPAVGVKAQKKSSRR